MLPTALCSYSFPHFVLVLVPWFHGNAPSYTPTVLLFTLLPLFQKHCALIYSPSPLSKAVFLSRPSCYVFLYPLRSVLVSSCLQTSMFFHTLLSLLIPVLFFLSLHLFFISSFSMFDLLPSLSHLDLLPGISWFEYHRSLGVLVVRASVG